MNQAANAEPLVGFGRRVAFGDQHVAIGQHVQPARMVEPAANSLTAKPWAAVGIVPLWPRRRLGHVDGWQQGRIGFRRAWDWDRRSVRWERSPPLREKTTTPSRRRSQPPTTDNERGTTRIFRMRRSPSFEMKSTPLRVFRLRRGAAFGEIGRQCGNVLVRQVLSRLSHQMARSACRRAFRLGRASIGLRYIRPAGRTIRDRRDCDPAAVAAEACRHICATDTPCRAISSPRAPTATGRAPVAAGRRISAAKCRARSGKMLDRPRRPGGHGHDAARATSVGIGSQASRR